MGEQKDGKNQQQKLHKKKARLHVPDVADANTLGKRIRHHRERLGITLEEINSFSSAHLCRVELDLARPGHKKLVALAKELGVDVDELRYGHRRSEIETSDQLENASSSTNQIRPVAVKLYTTDPHPSYFSDLKSAKELWTSGLNLRRFLSGDEDVLESVLARPGGHLKVMLLHPSESVYLAHQEKGVGFHAKVATRWICDAYRDLQEMQNERPGKLEIRLIRYPFGASFDIVNPDTENWIAYVRIYPIRKRRLDEIGETHSELKADHDQQEIHRTVDDQPTFRLTYQDETHRDLLVYYKQQFVTLWKDFGEKWPKRVSQDFCANEARRPRGIRHSR